MKKYLIGFAMLIITLLMIFVSNSHDFNFYFVGFNTDDYYNSVSKYSDCEVNKVKGLVEFQNGNGGAIVTYKFFAAQFTSNKEIQFEPLVYDSIDVYAKNVIVESYYDLIKYQYKVYNSSFDTNIWEINNSTFLMNFKSNLNLSAEELNDFLGKINFVNNVYNADVIIDSSLYLQSNYILKGFSKQNVKEGNSVFESGFIYSKHYPFEDLSKLKEELSDKGYLLINDENKIQLELMNYHFITDYSKFNQELVSIYPTSLKIISQNGNLDNVLVSVNFMYEWLLITLIVFFLVFDFRIIRKGKIRKAIFILYSILFLIVISKIFQKASSYNSISEQFFWLLAQGLTLTYPTILLYLSINVDEVRKPKMKLFGIVLLSTISLFVIVISNNYHQLFFKYNALKTDVVFDFRFNILTYIAIIYNFILLCYSILILVIHVRKGPRLKRRLLPLLFIVLIILVNFVYYTEVFNIKSIDNLLLNVVILIMFVQTSILTKLIGSSSSYIKVFENSSLKMELVDNEDNLVISSVKNNEDNQELKVDIIKINGGYFKYYTDIKELKDLEDKLNENNKLLKYYESSLINEEKTIKELAILNTRTNVYHKVELLVDSKIQELVGLIKELEYENTDLLKVKIDIRTCYIKRRSLFLIKSLETPIVKVGDILMSFNELYSYAKLSCVNLASNFELNGIVNYSNGILLYDTLYSVLCYIVDNEIDLAFFRIYKEKQDIVFTTTLDKVNLQMLEMYLKELNGFKLLINDWEDFKSIEIRIVGGLNA